MGRRERVGEEGRGPAYKGRGPTTKGDEWKGREERGDGKGGGGNYPQNHGE